MFARQIHESDILNGEEVQIPPRRFRLEHQVALGNMLFLHVQANHPLLCLLAFCVPMLLLGLVLRKPLERFLAWYVARVDESKLVA